MKKFTLISLLIIAASVFCRGQVPELWGMTSDGGLNANGTIFKVNGDGTDSMVVHNFIDTTGNAMGQMPFRGLLLHSNGLIYGVTYFGGIDNEGVLFSFDRSTGTYAVLHDFYIWDGNYPSCNLIECSNGVIYGTTELGGINGGGTIFSFNPITNMHVKLYDMPDSTGRGCTGSLVESNSGILYGLAQGGGMYNDGVIFSYDILSNSYTKIFDFDSINGKYPYGSLIQASNGKLYGMTNQGGASNLGVLFSFDPVGNSFNKLYDFVSATGSYPESSLVQASNGKLYGTTTFGGSYNLGTIFSYDLVNNSHLNLYNFDYLINGGLPSGSLIEASDGKLYGMALGGPGNGVVFNYDISNNSYSKVFDVTNIYASAPHGDLIEISTPSNTYSLQPKTTPLHLSPNPAKDILKIAFSLPANEGAQTGFAKAMSVEVKVFDVMGKEFLSQHIISQNTKLETKNFPAGIYFVKVVGKKINETGKFVKE